MLMQEKKAKEHALAVCVLALRSGQTCITSFGLRCRPTRQTHGGKSEYDALALFGANARSPNGVPQARTHGWVRACESYGEISL